MVVLDIWLFNEGALSFFRKNGLVPFSVRLWNRQDGEEPRQHAKSGPGPPDIQ